MSVTVTVENRVRGRATGTINLGTYATGGVAVTPGEFGYGRLTDLEVHPASGYQFEWDEANSKVKAYWQRDSASTTYDKHALAQVDDTTDLSGVTAHFEASGY